MDDVFVTENRPPYGPLVESCRRYGIARSKAFQLAREGLIRTFAIGRRRFVYMSSLDELPDRLAERANAVPAKAAA